MLADQSIESLNRFLSTLFLSTLLYLVLADQSIVLVYLALVLADQSIEPLRHMYIINMLLSTLLY